jgi:DNA-binding NtrC family response regulator
MRMVRTSRGSTVIPESPTNTQESVDADVATSIDLLRTISEVLDVRTVFPRLSEIANRILPHDALAMRLVDRGGRVVIEAATADLLDLQPHALETLFREDVLIGDLTAEELPVGRGTNPRPRLVARGYRSVLATAMRTGIGAQVLAVGFWSKHPYAYRREHLPLARRIVDHIAVDHIAVGVSHEQLATAARDDADGRARTSELDAPRRMLTRGIGGAQPRIVGESPAWQEVLRKATQVAATETTVLLTGESGTGKEVTARFIHRASARRAGPFVAMNCAAVPEQLLEAELFGYERGAFTSAHQAKPGQVELASGGVLFLDEVSEMSLSAQAKFLRVLQGREFQRLGGTRLLKANIRVIAATNRDPRQAFERGEFREDLFYGLGVFDIRIPPLRERPSDILPLSETVLKEIGSSFGRPPAGLTRHARHALLEYEWPGNVRELRNVLERATILCEGALIDANHLNLQSGARSLRNDTIDLSVVERTTIAKVLHECRGNKTRAAQRLGLSRTQLHLRTRKHRLEEGASA